MIIAVTCFTGSTLALRCKFGEMFELYDVTATLSQFSFAACSNIKTGTNFNAGSFATVAISELQRAADAAAAAAAAAASDLTPATPVVFEIHVRSGSRARQLLPRVEVTSQCRRGGASPC
jgi:hypothetical protein